MIYKTIEEWIERNPNHVGMIPIEVCRQIWGTKKKEWVNLTVEERATLRTAHRDNLSGLISAVQMMLKEKNT